MAPPSPELGQPKAPDKGDSSTTVSAGATTEPRGATNHDGGATRSSETAKPPAQDSENFEHFDDGQLKALLDEAITYKTPKDREHKSEAFKILLERAEIQEQAQELNYEFKASRTSGGSLQDLANPADVDFFGSSMNHQRKHHNSRQKKYSTTSSVSSRQREGGSLPSNVNVATNHLYQYESTQPFLNEVKSKRSGGRKVDIHPIVMYSSCTSDLVDKRERKLHGETEGGGVLLVSREAKLRVSDDVQHLEHDSLAQNHGDPLGGDECGNYEKNSLNKIPRASFTSQKNIDLGHHSTQVDKSVEFSALTEGCGTKNVDMTPLQLNPSYKSVNSVVNPIIDPSKNVQASLTHRIAVKQANRDKTDENGNSVNSFNATATVTVPQTSKTKKKISKAERNTIIKNSHDIDGFRGSDNIDSLVRFIENKENTRKNALKASSSKNSNNSNSSNSGSVIVSSDRVKKEKKSSGGGEKKKESGSNKLKKSNSMDELSSCSKLEEIARSENVSNHENGGVTLRAKGKKVPTESTPLLGGGGKGGKRGERRSWGTEELSYLGETEVTEVQQGKKEKEKEGKSSKGGGKDVAAAVGGIIPGGNLKGKKDDQQSLSVESMSYEMAEFHVVTKKKKPKKRQNIIVTPFEGDSRTVSSAPKGQNVPTRGSQKCAKVVYNHQTSSHFANDRDVYVNDRRKSTSSVPPSEKSDSSDLDSVHSLPVESSTALSLGLTTIPTTHPTTSTPPQASYADIARIANSAEQRFQLKDNWPAMPLRHGNGTTNQEAMETASTNSGSSYKSQNSVVQRIIQEPPAMIVAADDAAPQSVAEKKSPGTLNGIIGGVGMSVDGAVGQNMADVIKSSMEKSSTSTPPGGSGESGAKVQLQKSKSVEADVTAYFGSIDQYPALEKTIKSKVQHKTVPNVDMMTKKLKSIVSSSFSGNSVSISGNCSSVSQNLAVNMSLVEQLKSPGLVSSVNSRCDRNAQQQQQQQQQQQSKMDDSHGSISSSSSSRKSRRSSEHKTSSQLDDNRPAVIILNDNDRYQLNEGITFGFDINNQLLFGDFNENELHLLESASSSSTTTTTCGQNPDTGYGSNASTTDSLINNTSVSSQKSSEDTNYTSETHFNHSLDDTYSENPTPPEENVDGEEDEEEEENSEKCDPMPILKACVSVQTSMEHLYINDTQPPVQAVRVEDSSIIASIPAQISFTHADSESNNIMQMLSPAGRRLCGKKLNVRYVAPAEDELNLTAYNHDKIVNYVGLAWETVAGNDGVQYYDGQ
ncbi:uncharacterized protein LOC129809720 isoform X2 [Phlebotomus papatasi]|uniref:uncharacterized protein LOC129809720 isoform X2 n=1 Tax=Phlebotomus papatasi TaxID=29031 RepID=UPI00248395B7|nr:uncharacterized protein LOC129809720 isoform X2 [Phlebotomus papatasi]